jgi:hypothetical protein
MFNKEPNLGYLNKVTLLLQYSFPNTQSKYITTIND